MRKTVFGSLLVAVAVLPTACSTTPTGPSTSFTSPIASSPASGASYKFKEQPVTLSITNAVQTGSSAITYSVEVATDTTFANKVYTKDSITGGAATTSVTLGNLNGNTTYYWHWRSTVDGVSSPASPTLTFTVQQQIIINTPAPQAPAVGLTATTARPTFTTANATRQGAVGAIKYEFQVSTSSSFSPVSATATIAEGSGGVTSWTPTSDLPTANLFWRVRARDDSNSELSNFSNGSSFAVQPFDMRNAIIINNPPDLGSWTEISKVTFIDTTTYVAVDFDIRGQWPEVGFGSGALEYTLGMCANISKQWYCSAVIQFWKGRELEAGGLANEIGINWYYGRWGALNGYQPARGETVGLFAAAGNLRDNAGNIIAKERTNVQMIPWGGVFDHGVVTSIK